MYIKSSLLLARKKMAGNVITMYAIFEAFKNSSRQVMRGENAYKSGHVKKMVFDSTSQSFTILGEVQASMKKRNYSVKIIYDVSDGVKHMKCTCPRGLVVCHHMASLLFHAHYNISSTDTVCKWNAPKSTASTETPKTLNELFPPKWVYQATNNSLAIDKINEFRSNLGPTSVVGFSWLLKPEVTNRFIDILPSIENILYSEEYISARNKKEYFLGKCGISKETIEMVAQETVGQHANEKWLVARKMRLTGSKFGLVLGACQRQKFPPSLFKNLLEGYNLDKALAIQWGKDNEETALTKFIEETNMGVVPTGMWLDESGFLAASPDGLIGDDAVLEIKCPYRYRTDSLKQGVADKKYFFYYQEGNIMVKADHAYYHQVQGQLHMTNRSTCFFFVWTPEEVELFRIEKDPEWGSNIDTLRKFYLNNFLPHVIKD